MSRLVLKMCRDIRDMQDIDLANLLNSSDIKEDIYSLYGVDLTEEDKEFFINIFTSWLGEEEKNNTNWDILVEQPVLDKYC